MATFSMNVEAQKTSNGKKVLVAYFSRSGNTKAIASHINEADRGRLYSKSPRQQHPYPEIITLARKLQKRTRMTTPAPN